MNELGVRYVQRKVLHILEFDKVKEQLAEHASSPLGLEKSRRSCRHPIWRRWPLGLRKRMKRPLFCDLLAMRRLTELSTFALI